LILKKKLSLQEKLKEENIKLEIKEQAQNKLLKVKVHEHRPVPKPDTKVITRKEKKYRACMFKNLREARTCTNNEKQCVIQLQNKNKACPEKKYSHQLLKIVEIDCAFLTSYSYSICQLRIAPNLLKSESGKSACEAQKKSNYEKCMTFQKKTKQMIDKVCMKQPVTGKEKK
jgi:hypothetical protein